MPVFSIILCVCSGIEDDLANLRLLDEEEEVFQENAVVADRIYQYCLVGRCLTNSVVHFPSLRNTMANLWHPIRELCILDLGDKRRNWGSGALIDDIFETGPTDLMIEEENNPIVNFEGKKMQRKIEGSVSLASNVVEASQAELVASFGEQSSRSR
ncbi:hypothetical protein J1N35_007261 [Gossypium stocksii]|uniref:DUF4283 domain-containing protein n=1 Tax=Gossypium stocksii TaxID=47602 RepID=A0A9D3W866_9ROSI|nr:hypothetical protein J1N35_007261 [Gossypium stocksii]